jgi:hypothetical protein
VDPDHARRLAVDRNLAAPAFGHLTDAFTELPFEALGPTKTLLKRFFSTADWGPDDDAALAMAVGPGQGWWERPLDADLTLVFGWDAGGFGVEVRAEGDPDDPDAIPDRSPVADPLAADPLAADPLAADFDGPVVPEATPSPRTIRFAVGRALTGGASNWYASAAEVEAADSRAARLFGEFDEVTGVLVGPDFVAVMLRRPADWERLLRPVLATVTEEFSEPGDERAAGRQVAAGGPAGAGAAAGGAGQSSDGRRMNRLEQAWRDLGSLRPAEPDDRAALLAAASDADRYRRQVAANLLREADPATAAAEWARLVTDPVGAVRRAAVDAMVDAGRDELRALFESTLADADGWVRWKALRGLVELGPGPSREAIAACATDPDFRVRLEAAGALRSLAGA